VKKSGTAPKPAARPVAAPPEPLGLDDDEPVEPKPAKKSGTAPKPAARKRRDDEDGGKKKSRTKRAAKAGGPPVVLVLSIAGLIGLGIVCAVGYAAHSMIGGTDGTTGGGPRAAVPSGWKEFKPAGGEFKAYFPTSPKEEDHLVPGSKLYEAVDAGTGLEFTIATLPLPPEATPAQRKEAIDGLSAFAASSLEKGKEVSRKDVTWSGQSATEVVIEGSGPLAAKEPPPATKGGKKGPAPKSGGRPHIVLRFLFVGGKAFVGSIETKDGRPKPEIENGFFDSFEVLK
jgi:hypothetical protein